MERDTLMYKVRRKVQVLAHKVLSNEILSKIYFRIVLHKSLSLSNPQTFNEKIQWLKLYYYPKNQDVITCADKYAVRKYITNKGYGNKLVPMLGCWEKSEDILWDNLPHNFVLKCNHGCAYNIVVENKCNVDRVNVGKQLDDWLKEDFGAFNIELHYSKIKHHLIICEKYLGYNITDYKFFCFQGKPYCVYVSRDLLHDRQAQLGFYYLDGRKMPLHRDDYDEIENVTFPTYYKDMESAARKLAEGFPFVRVDFFVTDETWYFAELTFTPSAGMMPFNPEKYDLQWGKMISIDNLV